MDKLAMIQFLFAAWPNTSATPATVAVWLEMLADIPDNELLIVVHQAIAEGGAFPPSIGQLRDRWRQAKSPVSPDAAAAGLQSLRKAINGVGAWGYPKFRDPIVGKVVEAMGWDMICASENWSTDRAHFLRLYESFARQDGNEQRLTTEYKALRDESRQKQLESKDES